MSKVTHADLGWAVLAHPTGEVLAAEARSPGLHLGLLGVPPGFDRRDAEGWLYDVAGVAHDSSATRPPSRPIPALLDQAMTGLLFSHGELWDQPGMPSPCSFAFVEGRGEVGFGWIGDAKVSVWVDGAARNPAWITLRDERGRQARAWSIPSHHEVQVRISWSRSPFDPAAGGAEVEAAWNVAGRTEPGAAPAAEPGGAASPVVNPATPAGASIETRLDALAAAAHAASGPGEGADASAAAADETHDWVAEYEAERQASPGFWARVRNAIAGMFGRRPRPDEATTAADRALESMAGPAPVDAAPEAMTPVAGPEAAAEAPPALAELIPPTPEEPTAALPPGLETAVITVRSGSGGLIPPSPEPPEVTTRALLWGDADDPNAIDLPALESEVPAAAAPPSPAQAGESTAPPSGLELEITDSLLDEPLGLGRAPRPLEGLEPLAGAEATPTFEPDAEPDTMPASNLESGAAPTGAAGAIAAPQVEAAPVEETAAEPAVAAPARIPPLRPAWPSPQELARPRWLPTRRHGIWIALVGALFAGGWLVGTVQDDGRPRDVGRRGALGQALSAIGLGGPRFVVQVNSRPPGAWISVDGENLTLRTPAAIEVPPGEHTIGLSFTEFGSATFPVRGRQGERVPLDARLWGALDVVSPSEVGVISVSVDGVPRGQAPVRVDSLSPGVHEVRFSGLNIAAWSQTVDIRVGETREILARAVQSPSSGVLQVEATLADDTGTRPLTGAQVWIDGELRGSTPLTLDLPRGPHSVRLVHKGQEAPIQVIDLPGGNQRFAVFELGLDMEVPRLTVDVPARIPRDRPTVVSATVVGVASSEVREMWLHVRMSEGAWRRYGMTILKSPAGAAGAATFPTAAFDEQGRSRYYVSAHSVQGDEIVTEIRPIALEPMPR